MATLKKTRAGQKPVVAEFTFDIANADDMKNTSGVVTAFKAAAGTAYDVIPIPKGSRVIGGEIVVKTVSNDGSTATLSVGDSGSAARYLAATNIKAAARTAFTPTGYVSTGEDLRITLANATGNATTGKVTVSVQYIKEGREDEVIALSQVTA